MSNGGIRMTAEGITEARTEVGKLGLLLQHKIWKDLGQDIQVEAKRLLSQTAEHFEHEVTFQETLRTSQFGFLYHMQVTDPVWNILDLGAPSHPIVAKNAPFLVFSSGPREAKTVPGRLRTQPGFRAEGADVYTKAVLHPGLKPRMWTDLILLVAAEYSQTRFTSMLDKFLRMMKYVQGNPGTTKYSRRGTPPRAGNITRR